MSTEYDDKIVRMQFDNKQFESGVQTTIASLDELKASLKFDGVTTGIDNLASKVKNVSFDNMTQGIEQVVVKIPVMGTVLDQTIRNMTNSVTSFVKTTLDKFSTLGNMKSGFGEYELQINSVRTIMAATGETVETVNKYLEELNEYADQTIYSFSDMTKNIGSFTNAGVELDRAVAAIKGVSNLAAVSGANAQQASHAMVNFAQSLSQGYMGLVDWSSIRTAQMDTMEFKNELLKTAEALGTVKRQGDMYVSTTTNAAGKTSEAFNASKNFRETLQNQWLTTDVLITTLNRYNDTTTEIGKKATKAATEVNTLSQALDTIVEDLGSSWSTSWRYIIGDIDQATSVWTKFADAVKGVLGPSNDARNAMLKFWATGKDGAEEAIELTEEETKKYQALFDVAHQGVMGDWGNGADRMNKLTAAGYDYAEVQGVINKIVDGSVKSWEDLATAQKKEQKAESDQMTGREMFLQGLKNLYTAIAKFGGAIKAAWRDIFPKKNGNALVAMSESFMKLTEKLIISDKTADEIRRTFRGLFSVLGLVATVIKAVIKGIGALVMALISGTKKSNASIWTITAVIGDLLTAFTAIVRESGILESVFISAGKVIGTTGRSIINIIGSIVKALWNLIKAALGMKDVDFNLDLITNVFAVAAGSIAVFSDFIASKIEAFGFIPVTGIETFTANVKNAFGFFTQEGGPFAKAVDFFLAAWEKLKIGLMVVAAALAPVVKFIKQRLEDLVGGELTLENFLAFLKSGGALVLLAELVGLIHNLRKVLHDFVGVGKATTTMFEAFGDTAKAMTKKLKIMALKLLAAALLQIAIAIAVMVGAVYVLSKMDDDALKKGITAFTAIMAELIITLRNMKAAGIDKAAKTVMAIGIAIFLLTKSVMTLGSANAGDVLYGIGLIALILKELTSAVQDFSKNFGKLENVAATLIGLAIAILLLTIPVKIFGSMDTDVLMQGLAVVGGLIIILSLMVRLMEKADFNGVAKTLIGMAFALILLIVPIKVLGEMDEDALKQGAIAVISLIIILTAAVIALMKFSKDAKIDKGVIGLLWTMVAIVIVFALLTRYLGEMDTDTLLVGIAFIIIFLGLIVVFLAATTSIIKDAKNLKQLITILGLMAAIVALFVILIAMMGNMGEGKLDKIAKNLLLVAIALAILMAGLVLLVKFGSNANVGSLMGVAMVMAAFGVMLLGVASAIYVAIKAFKMLNDMKISKDLMHNMAVFGAFLLLLVENMIGGAIGAILAAGPAIVSAMFKTIAMILEELAKNISGFVSSIMSIIGSIVEGVAKSPLSEIVSNAVTIFAKILKGIADSKEDLITIGESLVAIICGLFEGLTSEKSLGNIADSIITFIENLADVLNDSKRVERAANAMVDFIEAVVKAMITAIVTVFSRLYELGEKIVEPIKNAIENKFSSILKTIFDKIEEIVNWIKDKMRALGIEVEDSDWDTESASKKATKAYGDYLAYANPVSGAAKLGNTLSNKAKEWLFGRAKGGTITASASGNVVNPSHSIVGEAGPELLSTSKGRTVITPLSNQYARSTTREMMERYTGNISNQLATINDNIVYANRHTFESTYDDTDIRNDMASMQAEMKGLREDILNVRVMLDTGALVGQLAGPMDKQFGSMNKLRVRASGSIKK